MQKVFYGHADGWQKSDIFNQLSDKDGNDITAFKAEDITDEEAQQWADRHAKIDCLKGENHYCDSVIAINDQLVKQVTKRLKCK